MRSNSWIASASPTEPETEPETRIEHAWRDEVRRRIEDIDAGRASLASWDEAKNRIFAHR